MSKDLVFDLSPTQTAFVSSDAEICLFIGPMGEGKTYAGVMGLIGHAARCGKNIRAALIRDTHTNIKISTVPDIKEMLGAFVSFHDDHKRMVIHSTPKVEVDLFGIDDPASLSKLQGPQYACIWLEEPAPIMEKANAGISEDVFSLAVARASRQKGTAMRVQITQNPADEDHWTAGLANAPEVYAEDEETGARIIKKTFRIPYGENKHLNAHTRIANKAAFQSDEGKYARYVEGREAPVQKGKRVIPGYNPSIHLSDTELAVVPGALGVRGWDGWHHPACIIGQHVAPGRLIVHCALQGDNVGVKELIEEQVRPLLNTRKYKGISDWRDIGDPTLRTPDQSSRQKTTAKLIEKMLRTRFEPGPTRWAQRIDPTNSAMTDLATDGNPKIILSKSAYNLHRALNGGWHWKVDNSGKIIGTVPVKDAPSQLGDAFTYMVAELFPYRKEMGPRKHVDPKTRYKLARSYGGRRAA